MNPHSVLGVGPDATPQDIKSAYRKLAMKHHPDQNGGSEESRIRFQEIQEAYNALRADKKPQDTGHFHQSRYSHHFDMGNVFDEFFRRQQMQNPSMQAVCDITLEQAYQGCTVSFNLPNGLQKTVDIPPGIDNGQVLRVPEGAGAPNPDLPAGDLNIVVRLRPHANFHRQGMTLLTRVQVDLLDILCGSEQEVVTITGETIKFTIPENSNPDTTVTIAHEGMNRVGGTERGDLIVHLYPRYPSLTQKQLRALKRARKT